MPEKNIEKNMGQKIDNKDNSSRDEISQDRTFFDHLKTFSKKFVKASLIVPVNTFHHLKDQNTLDGTTRPILQRVENFHKKQEIFKHVVDSVFKEKSADFHQFRDQSDEMIFRNRADDENSLKEILALEKDKFADIYDRLDDLSKDEIKRKNAELFSDLNQSTSSLVQEREELDNKNFNQIYSRIFTSLVLSGALDVLEIFSDILDNFGGDFAQSVGKTLRDPEVMQGFAQVNEAFRIDDTFEGLSKTPILNDINQFAVDALNSDYLSPISSLAHDFIGSEMAKFAFGGLVLANFVNSEVSLFLEYKDFDKKHKDALKEISKGLDEKINKSAEQISKLMAQEHVDNVRNYEYLKNYFANEGFKDDKEIEDLHFLNSQNHKIKLKDFTVDQIAQIDFKSQNCKDHNIKTFKDLIEKAKKFASNQCADGKESVKKKIDEKILEHLILSYRHNKISDIDLESSKDKSHEKEKQKKLLEEFNNHMTKIKDMDVDEKIKIFCEKYLAPEIKEKIINLKNEIEKSPTPTENPSAQDSIESSSTIPALSINPALTANSSKDQSEDRSDTKREFSSLADSNDDQKSVALSDIKLSFKPPHIELGKSPSQSPSPPFGVQRTLDGRWEEGAGVWGHSSERRSKADSFAIRTTKQSDKSKIDSHIGGIRV